MRDWRAAHPNCDQDRYKRDRTRILARQKKDGKKYRAENKNGFNEKAVERNRSLRKRNPTYAADSHRKLKYGLSPNAYKELLQSQDGACAICGTKENFGGRWNRPCVDHCHNSGIVRGLLCSKCNSAIGLLGDDVNLVAKALEYLTRKRG